MYSASIRKITIIYYFALHEYLISVPYLHNFLTENKVQMKYYFLGSSWNSYFMTISSRRDLVFLARNGLHVMPNSCVNRTWCGAVRPRIPESGSRKPRYCQYIKSVFVWRMEYIRFWCGNTSVWFRLWSIRKYAGQNWIITWFLNTGCFKFGAIRKQKSILFRNTEIGLMTKTFF